MGFCFGVRRAIDMVEKASSQEQAIESLGALVHNRRVVERLTARGVKVVETLGDVQGNTIATTAHGVGPQVKEEIARRGLQVLDTTCPIVQRAQKAVKALADAGFTVIVFGDPHHREVKGVLGWAGSKGIATTDWHQALPQRPPRRIGIVSQTTQSPAHFGEFVSNIVNTHVDHLTEVRVINTTCGATSKQQQAALELAQQADLMLVVGGRSSANTRHLAELCSEVGVETHHIEAATEIDPEWLRGKHRVGITAGASTPPEAIDEVENALIELSQGTE